MSVIFVFILLICGSLADSKKQCLLNDLKGVQEPFQHGKELEFECNLGTNIQGKQYAVCDEGVWLIAPCIGKITM